MSVSMRLLELKLLSSTMIKVLTLPFCGRANCVRETAVVPMVGDPLVAHPENHDYELLRVPHKGYSWIEISRVQSAHVSVDNNRRSLGSPPPAP